MSTTKSYVISKQMVWTAYQQVKENRGSAGIDRQSMTDFEENLGKNLYKIWNRMSSGSYFPPPVKQVPIPKKGGKGIRLLSVPTISDRIAQTVVKLHLEPLWDKHFHPDSYGYRPNRSAIDAIGVTRKRCWRYDWVVEFDIKGAFDSIDRALLMKAVHRHVPEKWMILYIERWLQAPIVTPDGGIISRQNGLAQGGVISPLLMNLFMHFAFDRWMSVMHRDTPFARYADDAVVHCRSRWQAERLLSSIAERLAECHLEIHPEKSKIVYCKDSNRRGTYVNTDFTFLGFTFRPRAAKSPKTIVFTSFQPSVSRSALKAMRQKIRDWKLHRRTPMNLRDIAEEWNPVIRGWWNYYGRFYPSDMHQIMDYFHKKVMQWARRKYRKLRYSKTASRNWLIAVVKKVPRLLFSATLFGIPMAE